MPVLAETESITYSFQVRPLNSSQQKVIEQTLKNLQSDSQNIGSQVQVLSKKLTPYDVILMIAITVTADITAKVLINYLDKLWRALMNQHISSLLPSLDVTQIAAEDYLRSQGVVDFQIIQKEDRGLYAFFNFKETTGTSHLIYITKSDKKVIQYQRK